MEESFDKILLLDVIEHLHDDVAFLKKVAPLSTPDARIIIAVPDFQFLWSQHDETFELRRRYSARQLASVVRGAGRVLERTTYTHSLLSPLAVIWRTLSYRLGLGRFAPDADFWPLPGWLNALLVRVYNLEAWFLRRFDLPVGVSLVCIARILPGYSGRSTSA